MAQIGSKLAWKLVTVAISIPVGIATKKGVEGAWRALRPNDPPHKPNDPDASWKDAVTWATISAVGVAVAQLATTKGASTIWRNLIGSEPPPTRKKNEVEEAVVASA